MKNEPTGAGIAEPPAEADSQHLSSRDAEAAGERRRTDSSDDGDDETKQQADTSRSVWREYFESLLVTAVMALFGMTFIVQAVKVPTGSMQNTILIGDHLLVNKFIFAPGKSLPFLPQREIRRGDIIVFKYPGNQFDPRLDDPDEMGDRPIDATSVPYVTNFVKRVIGMPGERIEVRGERVLINGQPLAERRVTATSPGHDTRIDDPLRHAPLVVEDLPAPEGEGAYNAYYAPETRAMPDAADDLYVSPDFHFGVGGKAAVVPADSYFVMGDNREDSHDSRAWGFVKRDLIMGRAMFVYWSYDESAPSQGHFLLDFWHNSRWNRTGTLIR
ncbi:MAG TPA: signal peptidase I [Pyrinomonadaceae bacterium]|jgi:signal peptidase I